MLKDWSAAKGQDGIEKSWADKNQTTIDGFETGILDPDRRDAPSSA